MNPISVNPYSNYSGYYSGNLNYPDYSGYYQQGGYSVPQNQSDESAKALGKVALLQGLALGISKVSQFFAQKIASAKEFTSFENVEKIANHMKQKHNLSTGIHYIDNSNKHLFDALGAQSVNEVASGRNAFFHPKFNVAVAPKAKPSLMPHEMGHAVNFTKPFTKTLQKFGKYALGAPTALVLANRLFPQRQDGQKTFIEKNAGLLGFGAFLPTLIEEGIASIRGIKAAKTVLGNPAGLKTLKKNYAFAWLTYLMGGVALGVASKQAVIQDKHNLYM